MAYQTAEESFARPGAGPHDVDRLDAADRCRCGRRGEVTIQYRNRRIVLCGRHFDEAVETSLRGDRRVD